LANARSDPRYAKAKTDIQAAGSFEKYLLPYVQKKVGEIYLSIDTQSMN
jgi:hypothetical protein